MHSSGSKTKDMSFGESKNRGEKGEERRERNVLAPPKEVREAEVSPLLSSLRIKEAAKRLGFSHCGLAPAEPVDEAFMAHYEQWLREGKQGEMHYMENHLALRRDPRLLLSGAKTVVSLAMSYNPGSSETQKGIAWYAQGRDYHEVIKERLQRLIAPLNPPMMGDYSSATQSLPLMGEPEGAMGVRICVDTAPIMEKYWAWRCGLGWIGRHTQLVIPHEGSAFFLAEILLTMEADVYDKPLYDTPYHAGCKGCRRCLDACPTKAISEHGMDARRCLSYLTIEYRGELPEGSKPYLDECFYGCDRCLRACPHLAMNEATSVDEFRPSSALLAMMPEDWSRLSVEEYRSLFRGSAVKRAKFEGLQRNIAAMRSQD